MHYLHPFRRHPNGGVIRLVAPLAALTLGCRLAAPLTTSTNPAATEARATETRASVVTDVPPTVSPAATTVVSAHDRVVSSLDRLVGMPPWAPALSSYHLEFRELGPVWDGEQVVVNETILRADVEGTNVHYSHQDPLSESLVEGAEVYLLGDETFVVEGGEIFPGLGLEGMSWMMWPVDASLALMMGSTVLEAGGSELLEGRMADVYRMSGSIEDDPSGELPGLGSPIVAANGNVWIDRETGALLKLSADYGAVFVDADTGAVNGEGTGHIEILVTEVGRVEVRLPD